MEERCKRCLLEDLHDQDLAAHLYQYIASLPDTIKADAATIKARLDGCRVCDDLINGMCRFSGCYVEVRAAKQTQTCPAIPPKWHS